MKNIAYILLLITTISCSKVSRKEVKMAYNELYKKQTSVRIISELSEEKINIKNRIQKYKELKNEDIVKQELRELKEIELHIAQEQKKVNRFKKILKLATSQQLQELKINKN
jgi:hypothetical protein